MKKAIKKKTPLNPPVNGGKKRKTPLKSPRERGETKAKRKPPMPPRKQKGNSAFMAPMQPDAVLAAIVGEKARSRPEIVSRLWEYIRRHDLQDAVNRRQINCDGPLRALFGKDTVGMLEMHKLLSAHLRKA